MAYAGQTLDNPITGERITFRRTAADTAGEVLEFDLELAPDGHVPGKHVHPAQEERFEVVSGTMKFKMGRVTRIAHAGDTVVVPAGTPHKFENGGDETAHVRVQVTPALRMENLLETATQLAIDGRTNKRGMPKPLDFALFVREFENEVVGAFPPVWVQKATMAPVAWIARHRDLPGISRPVTPRRSSAAHPVLG
jgi:quercetin dioxygenase-like cupin family protein